MPFNPRMLEELGGDIYGNPEILAALRAQLGLGAPPSGGMQSAPQGIPQPMPPDAGSGGDPFSDLMPGTPGWNRRRRAMMNQGGGPGAGALITGGGMDFATGPGLQSGPPSGGMEAMPMAGRHGGPGGRPNRQRPQAPPPPPRPSGPRRRGIHDTQNKIAPAGATPRDEGRNSFTLRSGRGEAPATGRVGEGLAPRDAAGADPQMNAGRVGAPRGRNAMALPPGFIEFFAQQAGARG